MRNRKIKIEIAGTTVAVTGLFHHSQQVQPGGVYFALKDGSYVAEAVRNGAAVIVAADDVTVDLPQGVVQIKVPDVRSAMAWAAKAFYGNIVDKMRVTGVVGTNGKTTTTYIMQHVLEMATGKNVGVIGTTGVLNAGKTWEGVTTLTTPDPIDLHRALACMYRNGVRDVVMEVSAHAIYYHKVDGINFAGVIFTNITQDHLDFFTTFENYKNTKLGFFQKLTSGTVVINADDQSALAVAAAVNRPGLYSISYSLKHDTVVGTAQWAFIDQVNLTVSGSDFVLGKAGHCHLALPGLYNVYNAVAAALLANHYGVNWSVIKEALATMPAVPGRFNLYHVNGVTAVIDYAHTPDGLEQLLKNARAILPKTAKLWAVFGCGGDRDRLKRPKMGAIAFRLADYVVLTSDNPRTENPEAIIDEIERGIKTMDVTTLQQHLDDALTARYTRITDRAQAIEYAVSQAHDGDMVVIAGKGHENYMDINQQKIPYMDSKVLDNILRR